MRQKEETAQFSGIVPRNWNTYTCVGYFEVVGVCWIEEIASRRLCTDYLLIEKHRKSFCVSFDW